MSLLLWPGREPNPCRLTADGMYAEGKQGMKTLPDGFDSVVNQPHNPYIYVTFQDQQAYPAYLVEFST